MGTIKQYVVARNPVEWDNEASLIHYINYFMLLKTIWKDDKCFSCFHSVCFLLIALFKVKCNNKFLINENEI